MRRLYRIVNNKKTDENKMFSSVAFLKLFFKKRVVIIEEFEKVCINFKLCTVFSLIVNFMFSIRVNLELNISSCTLELFVNLFRTDAAYAADIMLS